MLFVSGEETGDSVEEVLEDLGAVVVEFDVLEEVCEGDGGDVAGLDKKPFLTASRSRFGGSVWNLEASEVLVLVRFISSTLFRNLSILFGLFCCV